MLDIEVELTAYHQVRLPTANCFKYIDFNSLKYSKSFIHWLAVQNTVCLAFGFCSIPHTPRDTLSSVCAPTTRWTTPPSRTAWTSTSSGGRAAGSGTLFPVILTVLYSLTPPCRYLPLPPEQVGDRYTSLSCPGISTLTFVFFLSERSPNLLLF